MLALPPELHSHSDNYIAVSVRRLGSGVIETPSVPTLFVSLMSLLLPTFADFSYQQAIVSGILQPTLSPHSHYLGTSSKSQYLKGFITQGNLDKTLAAGSRRNRTLSMYIALYLTRAYPARDSHIIATVFY